MLIGNCSNICDDIFNNINSNDLKYLSDGKCPDCGGRLLISMTFDNAVLCKNCDHKFKHIDDSWLRFIYTYDMGGIDMTYTVPTKSTI